MSHWLSWQQLFQLSIVFFLFHLESLWISDTAYIGLLERRRIEVQVRFSQDEFNFSRISLLECDIVQLKSTLLEFRFLFHNFHESLLLCFLSIWVLSGTASLLHDFKDLMSDAFLLLSVNENILILVQAFGHVFDWDMSDSHVVFVKHSFLKWL